MSLSTKYLYMAQIYDTSLILPNDYIEVSKTSLGELCGCYVSKIEKLVISNYIMLVQSSSINRSEPRGNIENIIKCFSNELIEKVKNENLQIVFDCSFEGSSIYFPFADVLHLLCETHNVSFSNFHYLTGDSLEKTTHDKKYSSNSINIYHVNVLDNYTRSNYLLDNKPNLEKECNFFFSCLNRKTRFWRSRLVYKILSSIPKEKLLISHAKVTSFKDIIGSNKFFDSKMMEVLVKHTPLLLKTSHDVKDFSGVFKDVYSQVMFDLAMETYQEFDQEYITEKTFKPMLNKVPVLLWGTPGINTSGLSKLGFKTYEDWFDLSFDLEKDTEKRSDLLMLEIKRLFSMFNNMTIQDRNAWSMKNLDVLNFNKSVVLNLLTSNRSEVMRLVVNLNLS